MAATETVVLAAAASSGIGVTFFTCFIILLTIFNLYALYKLYIKRSNSEAPIDVDAIRRNRLADEQRVSQHTSETTLALQASATAIVTQYETQRCEFAQLIGRFDQAVLKVTNSADDLEANQSAQTQSLELLTDLLAQMRQYYERFWKLSQDLFENLRQTQAALADKESALSTVVEKLTATEYSVQHNAEQLSKLTDILSYHSDIETISVQQKLEISALKDVINKLMSCNRALEDMIHEQQKDDRPPTYNLTTFKNTTPKKPNNSNANRHLNTV